MKSYLPEKINRQRLKYAAIGVLIFYFAANAFALLNFYPQHDALNHTFLFSSDWEYQMGRFSHHLFGLLRGNVVISPWLIGIISVFSLIFITYMLTELFELNKPISIIAAAAVLSANIAHTELLSVFIYVEDVCMAAALLACFAIYLTYKTKSKVSRIISVVLLVFSASLYQSFISFAAVLVLMMVMKTLIQKKSFSFEDYKINFEQILMIAAAVLIYFAVNKTILSVKGLTPAGGEHSLSILLNENFSIRSTLKKSIVPYIKWFLIKSKTSINIFQLCNWLLGGITVILFISARKYKKINFKTMVGFVILFFASIIASTIIQMLTGAKGFRMVYSFYLFYILSLFLVSHFSKILENVRFCSYIKGIVMVLVCIITWFNIVYSNGAFSVQKVLFDRAVSIWTRVLDDVYETPGYFHNQTPVVLVGDHRLNHYAYDITKEYKSLPAFSNTSITYHRTAKSFLRILGEETQIILDDNEIASISSLPDVMEMPSFPYDGYCKFVDGYLVIKF